MAISLYDVTVLGFIQTVGALEGVLQKGLAHCTEQSIDTSEIVEARLHPDMHPFRFQVFSVMRHSVGAIESAKVGLFTPPLETPAADWVGLQGVLTEASAKLKAYSRDEVDALQGRDMVFQLGERKIPFSVDDFLLSFSIPNVHFHATTAYGILRARGVPIGKRDYLGRLRPKG
jgi:hypothetical protein